MHFDSNFALEGVTRSHPTTAEGSDFERRLNEMRRQRSEEILNEISRSDERIDFSDVNLEVNEDESLQIRFNAVVESSGATEPLSYKSLDILENDIIPFEKESGQSLYEINVRGFCYLKSEEDVCINIVVEISYDLNGNTIIRQFQFAQQEHDEGEVEVVLNDTDEPLESEEAPEEVQEEDAVQAPAPTPVEPAPGVEPPPADPSATDSLDIEPPAVSEPEPLETEVEVVEEEPPPVTRPDESVSDLVPTASVRPRKRPENLMAASAQEDPDSEDPASEDHSHAEPVPEEEETEELTAGSGVFILPDPNENAESPNRLVFRDIGEVSGSYADLDADDFPVQTQEQFDLERLEFIQTNVFNQSRGLYYRANGHIVNDDQLTTGVPGLDLGPTYRRAEQYASGLTRGVLEWTVERFHAQYPDSPVCVNDLSKRGGGRLSGHSSHRNGLDIDVSIPSTENDCSGGRRFVHYENLMSDSNLFEKNWEFLKTLNATNRVHVVFVDRGFTSRLCEYTKTLDLNADELERRTEIFKKLHHIAGHARHYHIRLKCNEQNIGCQTQGILTGSRCE